MGEYSIEPVRKIAEAINDWQKAKVRVEQTEKAAVVAKQDLMQAEQVLAEWLVPKDAKGGEKFCIWYGNSLIQVAVSKKKHYPGMNKPSRYTVTERPIEKEDVKEDKEG